jgi:hypothetical protein
LVLTILWNKQSKIAAISSALLGLATGLAVWLGTAYHFSGEITISSTGGTLSCMYGTVASALSPLLYTVIISLLKPANYDWSNFKQEKLVVVDSTDEIQEQRVTPDVTTNDVTINDKATDSITAVEVPNSKTKLWWTRYALFWAVATFLGHWVLWPLPMYAAKYIFSKSVC